MRRWREAHRELSRERNRQYKRAVYARNKKAEQARITAHYAGHP